MVLQQMPMRSGDVPDELVRRVRDVIHQHRGELVMVGVNVADYLTMLAGLQAALLSNAFEGEAADKLRELAKMMHVQAATMDASLDEFMQHSYRWLEAGFEVIGDVNDSSAVEKCSCFRVGWLRRAWLATWEWILFWLW